MMRLPPLISTAALAAILAPTTGHAQAIYLPDRASGLYGSTAFGFDGDRVSGGATVGFALHGRYDVECNVTKGGGGPTALSTNSPAFSPAPPAAKRADLTFVDTIINSSPDDGLHWVSVNPALRMYLARQSPGGTLLSFALAGSYARTWYFGPYADRQRSLRGDYVSCTATAFRQIGTSRDHGFLVEFGATASISQRVRDFTAYHYGVVVYPDRTIPYAQTAAARETIRRYEFMPTVGVHATQAYGPGTFHVDLYGGMTMQRTIVRCGLGYDFGS